jgi:hypothetical protein
VKDTRVEGYGEGTLQPKLDPVIGKIVDDNAIENGVKPLHALM